MSSPTSGPWQIKGDYAPDFLTIIANVDGEIIDGTTHYSYDFIATCEDEFGEASLDAVANARLIAAAPELFEALEKALVSVLEDREVLVRSHAVSGSLDSLSDDEAVVLADYDAVVATARAALTKARGQSSLVSEEGASLPQSRDLGREGL